MSDFIVVAQEGNVQIRKKYGDESAIMIRMSWPEANALQSQLRQACVGAGITVQP